MRERRERRGLTIAAQKARRAVLIAEGVDAVSQIHRAVIDITGSSGCQLDELPEKDEARLLGLCWLLALYDECWRAGPRRDHPVVMLGPTPSWRHLQRLKPDVIVLNDLMALCRVTTTAAPEILQGDVVCNPVFDVPGLNADADLIVDGCLWEVKTTMRPGFDRLFIYQLLGYCLLDLDDAYGLREIGLYRARLASAQRWSMRELLEVLAGRQVDIPWLRSQFAAAAAARYEWVWSPRRLPW